jgi:hypothetical protein
MFTAEDQEDGSDFNPAGDRHGFEEQWFAPSGPSAIAIGR